MRQVIDTALTLLKIHVLRKRVPLFVSWNITFRCNLRCLYCAACEAPHDELGTSEFCPAWMPCGAWARGLPLAGANLVRADIDNLHYSKNKGFRPT